MTAAEGNGNKVTSPIAASATSDSDTKTCQEEEEEVIEIVVTDAAPSNGDEWSDCGPTNHLTDMKEQSQESEVVEEKVVEMVSEKVFKSVHTKTSTSSSTTKIISSPKKVCLHEIFFLYLYCLICMILWPHYCSMPIHAA